MGVFRSILDACDRLVVQRFERNESQNLVKVGIAAGISAVVAACVATHKTEKIIAEVKTEVSDQIEVINDEKTNETEKKEAAKEIALTAAPAVAKISGFYAVVGILECVSIKSFLKSNEIYKADAAMWASIAAGYLQRLIDYRKIIAEKIGAEAEEEAYYGVEKKTVPVMEDGKLKKKKVRVIEREPANKNILLFSPWTSDIYRDEDTYGDTINIDHIRGSMKNAGMQIQYWKDRWVTNNDIAQMLQIQKSVEWQTLGFVYGDEIHYKIRKVYAEYEGKWIPVYYIELNSMPLTMERLNKALPYAPDYTKELAAAV